MDGFIVLRHTTAKGPVPAEYSMFSRMVKIHEASERAWKSARRLPVNEVSVERCTLGEDGVIYTESGLKFAVAGRGGLIG